MPSCPHFQFRTVFFHNWHLFRFHRRTFSSRLHDKFSCLALSYQSSPQFQVEIDSLQCTHAILTELAVISKLDHTYLESSQHPPTSQFGYCKHNSTNDALVLTVNTWSVATSRQEYSGFVSVDMPNVFGHVQNAQLLTGHFSLGISGNPVNWFADYFSSRFQHITKFRDVSLPCCFPFFDVSHKAVTLVHCSLSCPLGQ